MHDLIVAGCFLLLIIIPCVVAMVSGRKEKTGNTGLHIIAEPPPVKTPRVRETPAAQGTPGVMKPPQAKQRPSRMRRAAAMSREAMQAAVTPNPRPDAPLPTSAQREKRPSPVEDARAALAAAEAALAAAEAAEMTAEAAPTERAKRPSRIRQAAAALTAPPPETPAGVKRPSRMRQAADALMHRGPKEYKITHFPDPNAPRASIRELRAKHGSGKKDA